EGIASCRGDEAAPRIVTRLLADRRAVDVVPGRERVDLVLAEAEVRRQRRGERERALLVGDGLADDARAVALGAGGRHVDVDAPPGGRTEGAAGVPGDVHRLAAVAALVDAVDEERERLLAGDRRAARVRQPLRRRGDRLGGARVAAGLGG